MNIINQGKLDPNKSSNEIIVENNVLAEIIKIDIIDCFTGILEVSLKLLSGEGTGKIIKDKVCYLRNEKLTWKYLDLRESAFCPYYKDESERVCSTGTVFKGGVERHPAGAKIHKERPTAS